MKAVTQTEEQELKSNISAAQKVWSQRIDETERAKKAEAIAKKDLDKAANRYVRSLTRRI